MKNFWQQVEDYEWLLDRYNETLNLAYYGPTEPDRWNAAVDVNKMTYQLRQFWSEDRKFAYEKYIVSRTPLPQHFAYLWEEE